MSDKPASKTSPGVSMDVRVGQVLVIGTTRVTIEKKTGQVARLRVVAEKGILIRRLPQEIAETAALVPG